VLGQDIVRTSMLESSEGRLITEFKIFRAFCIFKLAKEINLEILYIVFNCCGIFTSNADVYLILLKTDF